MVISEILPLFNVNAKTNVTIRTTTAAGMAISNAFFCLESPFAPAACLPSATTTKALKSPEIPVSCAADKMALTIS